VTPSPSSPTTVAARVAALVRAPARALVVLDHDGTLSPIAPTPDAAELAAGAAEALTALAKVADVAILSGRGLEDLAQRFRGLPLTLVSEHGLRAREDDGAEHALAAPLDAAELEVLRGRLHTLLAGRVGWIVEDKGVGLAVHHRLVPVDELHPTGDEVRELLEGTAARAGGIVQAGKAVLELRPRGADKGAALHWLARRTGARPIVMLGDDLTDEPAIAAAEGMGGIGVLVVEPATTQGRSNPDDVREHGSTSGAAISDEVSSAASASLAGPDAVVRFLEELAELLAAR
jgi:trehalose 6-phosphate phosphatase